MFQEKGFTILETVVALTIISVGILGILELFTQTIRSGEIGKNQEIAINLAQEGIEVIRNKRDSNWLDSKINWNSEIDETGYYKVNFKNDNIWEIIKLGEESFEKLYLKEEKIYIHETENNILSIFKRKIYIDNSETEILKITSTVQWTERGSEHSVIMRDDLYNWQ